MKRRKFIQNLSSGLGYSAMGMPAASGKPAGERSISGSAGALFHAFYQRSAQPEQVYHHAVLNCVRNGREAAFIRQSGESESIWYQNDPRDIPVHIAEMEFCISLVLCGDQLYWVERNGGKWNIRMSELSAPSGPAVHSPFTTRGRPNSLYAFTHEQSTYLLWEERQGIRTHVALAEIRQGVPGTVRILTDGFHNVYDPQGVVDSDGNLHVVYTCFIRGQYRIMHQELGMDLKGNTGPQQISDSSGPCQYPSICSHKEGGVWISYTDFLMPADFAHFDIPYSRHCRRSAQHRFFRSKAFTRVVHYRNGTIEVPFAPERRGGKEGNVTAGLVFGSEFSKRSQVFETRNGRVGVLVRKHQDYGKSLFDGISQLTAGGQAAFGRALNTRSDLVLICFGSTTWSDPVTLVRRAHYETPISCRTEGNTLSLAFTEDGRRTGWGSNGERFDNENEIGVGLLEVSLQEAGKPDYDFHLFHLRPVPPGHMEEPIPESRVPEGMTVFGQTHLHTENSVCTRAYDQNHHANYRFVQDVQKCRFAGMTDHGYNMGPCEQHHMRKMAEYYYFPGEFAALQAYEWTSSRGHVNPLSFEETRNLEVYTPLAENARGNTFEKLWKEYSGRNIYAPPHHVTSKALPFYWENFNSDFMPFIEVFQDRRGSTEQPGVAGVTNYARKEEGFWFMDQLLDGRRFAFIAGGDHSGLALGAVKVGELSRTGIFEAFGRKDCFATTGNLLDLSFSIDGHGMGSELQVAGGLFELEVRAPEVIERVEVVRNGKTERSIPVNSSQTELTWQGESGFTFCRILMVNGDLAWTSPIWIG